MYSPQLGNQLEDSPNLKFKLPNKSPTLIHSLTLN